MSCLAYGISSPGTGFRAVRGTYPTGVRLGCRECRVRCTHHSRCRAMANGRGGSLLIRWHEYGENDPAFARCVKRTLRGCQSGSMHRMLLPACGTPCRIRTRTRGRFRRRVFAGAPPSRRAVSCAHVGSHVLSVYGRCLADCFRRRPAILPGSRAGRTRAL